MCSLATVAHTFILFGNATRASIRQCHGPCSLAVYLGCGRLYHIGTNRQMNDRSEANEGVRALFSGVAPERPEEIEQILETIQYELADDRPALHLEATAFFGRGLVVLTNRTMQQIWLIAYLSWRTLREQSGFVIVALATRTPYDVSQHPKNDIYIKHVDRLGEDLTALRTADVGRNPWPSDVPRLDPQLSELRDEEDRAVYDLSCFAAAFVLLHETHHALKRARGETWGGVEEELECDRYATGFLLDRSDAYAIPRNFEPSKVFRKRAMGVFLGLAVTFESTEMGLWLASESHPSAYDRIRQLVQFVDPIISNEDDDFWIFASCVLLSRVRRGSQLPATIRFLSPRDLFYKALELIRIAERTCGE